jgi:putative ABC transport system permease protein
MLWLLAHGIRRSPRRLILAAIGVAFPVAMLAATLLLVDDASHSMTRVALAPVQVDMRALATTINSDNAATARQMAGVSPIQRAERFASVAVTVSAAGGSGPVAARLFAVDPEYLQHHPWVKVTDGQLGAGVLLSQPLRATAGFATATSIAVGLPGAAQQPTVGEDAPPPPVTLPAVGTVDLREARTWFAIPHGDAQGDIVNVPRALVVDYVTFERQLLPALRHAHAADPALNPNTTDLPPVTLETHLAIDHNAYPSDPAQASIFSNRLRRVLEQRTPDIIVADNAAEVLLMARTDATNAKILFLLLGIPGALVAAGLGLAAASTLAEAQRREDALLALRGATGRQLAWLASAHATIAGVLGAALGLIVAALAVSTVTGHQVWRQIPADRLAVTAAIASVAGALTVAVRVIPLVRAMRRGEVAVERRALERGWTPRWRRSRLDLIAIAAGAAILLINLLAGGLKQLPTEGQELALAFYVLMAPIALWLGISLVAVRGLSALLTRRTAPQRSRALTTWTAAAFRWLGRRPARTGVALVLGTLAVAFGANVVTFVATYEAAQRNDRQAAFGADLRITSPTNADATPSHPGIAAITPIRLLPARIGTDRKNIMAIDPATYQQTNRIDPELLSGEGVDALRRDPQATLVHAEIADGFALSVGDTLTLTLFPDAQGNARNLKLRVAGVYRSFAPNDPFSELVMNAAAIPQPTPAPDFYMANVASGQAPRQVAADLHAAVPGLNAQTIEQGRLSEQRSLTALNLRALGRLESVAAGLVAAVGVAVLGAFLVLERRREAAILRACGATTRQILTSPAIEGAIAVLGSLLLGIPVGIGVGILAVRILGLFFTLQPPLVVLPAENLGLLAGSLLAASLVALGVTLYRVTRANSAAVLREP